MIFGFNTDVRCGDTVYHVQSEARERERLLQTQVFVSGRCVAKRTTSYAAAQERPGFSPEQMHDLLRTQHKEVIELARVGETDKVSSPSGEREGDTDEEPERSQATTAAASAEVPLTLTWTNANDFSTQRSGPMELRFFVSKAGTGIGDAQVTVRLNGSAGPPQYAQGITTTDGHARIALTFDPADHADTVALLVQALSQGRAVTRKYQLRRPVS